MKKTEFDKTKYPNIWKHKKNGTYAIDISLGYDSRGKRIRTTRTGIKSEKEAKRILADINIKKKIKTEITENYLFEDLLDEYYDYLLYSKKVKISTVRTKKSKMNSRILPFFRKMKIVNIKTNDIQKYHQYLNKIKKENGDYLDSETKHNLHKILSAYFNWLIDYRNIIYTNPCKTVSNFKIEKKELKYYKLDEINKLFDTINNDENVKEEHTKLFTKAIIKGLFFSGFRLGEFLGLKFKDIKYDILNNDSIKVDEIEIQINQTVSYGKGGWTITDGKTKESLRNTYLGKNAFQPIFDYIKYWQKAGIIFEEDDFIFTSPISGKIISPTQIRKQINYYMDKAGLERLKLKDFRHSFATLLLSNGYRLEDIKEELGHTSIRTTEKYYARLYDENKRNLAKDIDKLA